MASPWDSHVTLTLIPLSKTNDSVPPKWKGVMKVVSVGLRRRDRPNEHLTSLSTVTVGHCSHVTDILFWKQRRPYCFLLTSIQHPTTLWSQTHLLRPLTWSRYSVHTGAVCEECGLWRDWTAGIQPVGQEPAAWPMPELHNYSHVERCTVQEYEETLGLLCPDFVVWAETSKCFLIFLALGEKAFGLWPEVIRIPIIRQPFLCRAHPTLSFAHSFSPFLVINHSVCQWK